MIWNKVGNLSKKILILEAEKTDLTNNCAMLKTNYDQIMQKYSDVTAEAQRRITLKEHLNQTSDLKRKMDENNIFHKYELENTRLMLDVTILINKINKQLINI